MFTNLEALRALVTGRAPDPSWEPPAMSNGRMIALGLLVVAEAVREHTEAVREHTEGQAEGIADVSNAVRDLQREVAFIGSRVARGA